MFYENNFRIKKLTFRNISILFQEQASLVVSRQLPSQLLNKFKIKILFHKIIEINNKRSPWRTVPHWLRRCRSRCAAAWRLKSFRWSNGTREGAERLCPPSLYVLVLPYLDPNLENVRRSAGIDAGNDSRNGRNPHSDESRRHSWLPPALLALKANCQCANTKIKLRF